MTPDRSFLFLQGPHGPFFAQLAAMLVLAGSKTYRAGFNLGDEIFWPKDDTFLKIEVGPDDWAFTITRLIRERQITDLVLYGDTRPVHAIAIAAARRAGLRIHVFEEGYLRPFWITYERDGSNGYSRLMSLGLDQIGKAISKASTQAEAPTTWGDLRQHMFWGAVYHGFVVLGRRRYPAFQPHRSLTAGQEFGLYLRRLLLLPIHRWERMLATYRIRSGGFPYHLALLQLEHDASFRAHSPFSTMSEFIELVINGFAAGAPRHHRLVFKAHPLEDGRVPTARDIRRFAKAAGVADRVHFVRGGKLARLLDSARSAITINSTAGQQALWRGLPLRIFGTAIYGKPGLVSDQPLATFFARPDRPDFRAYRCFRQFLLETCQVPGGFYSTSGRRALLRQMADRMLADTDPYDALLAEPQTRRQHVKLVPGSQS